MDLRNPKNGEVYRAPGQASNSVSGASCNELAELRIVDNTQPCGWRRYDRLPVTNPKPLASIRKWKPYSTTVEGALRVFVKRHAEALAD